MGGDVNFQVEVPGRGAPGAGFPFAPEPQAGARIHPRRDAHLDTLPFLDHCGATAGGADLGDEVAGPLALGAGVEDFQESPGLVHLACAGAADTGLGRALRLGPAAGALPADDAMRDGHAGAETPGGLFQAQHHPLAQVGPGLGLFLAVPGTPEAKKIFEGLPEGAEDLLEAVEATQVQARQTGIAVQVIKLTPLGVYQDLVGF